MAVQVQILALAFKGLNILDLTGPAEVFGNSELRPACHITIASASPNETRSVEGVTLKTDISFQELLKNDAAANLSTYQILVVPGAPPEYVEDAIKNDHGLLEVVQAFAALKDTVGKQRWMFSICTGVGFLGTVGVLGGKTCTTHFGYIPELMEVTEKTGKGANVVRKRFVDAGKTESGA